MSTAIAVATLINNKRTRFDFDFIRTKVINNLRRRDTVHRIIIGCANIHRANTTSSRVKNHEFSLHRFSQLHRCPKNGSAISFSQSALTYDNNVFLTVRRRMIRCNQFGQAIAARTQVNAFICEINVFANDGNIRALCPSFANACIQYRGLEYWVCADQNNVLHRIDIFNRCSTNIARAIASRQFRAVCTTFNNTALRLNQSFQSVSRFNRNQITNKTGKFLTLHRRCNSA